MIGADYIVSDRMRQIPYREKIKAACVSTNRLDFYVSTLC
jgi:hypothetical protein